MDIEQTCNHNGIELFFKQASHIEMDRDHQEHVICDFCNKRVVFYLPRTLADIKTFVKE